MIFYAETLRKAVKAVKPAISINNSRLLLSGIHFKYSSGKCRISALDGYRIHREIICYEGEDSGEFVMPYIEILKQSELIRMTHEQGFIELDYMDGYKFTVPEIEGEYTDIEKLINKGNPEFSIAFNPTLLKEALATMIDGRKPVRLDFYGQTGACIITNNKENGDSSLRLVLPVRM